MKRRSLKLKITLWFTLILTVICVIMLTSITVLYRSADSKSIRKNLRSAVDEKADSVRLDRHFFDDLEEREEREEKFSETDYYKDGVELMIYDKDGEQLAGLFLHEDMESPYRSGNKEPKKITLEGKSYYLYDKWIHIPHEGDLCVRGIVTAEDNFGSVFKNHAYIFLAVPLLLVLAFSGGFWLTGRFLKPIKNISATAEEIKNSGDLAKRIEMKNTGDELYELSKTFNSMFDKLEENFEGQKQFTSNASHELRTPVSVILAQCEYAVENAQNEHELLDCIGAIQKQGYRMSRLIETLLIFTRIERRTDKYERKPADLAEIVRNSCEDISLIADNNIKVSCEVPENITANVNKELFRLAVNNLIQNAVKYGRENGFVKVELTQNDEYVYLNVTDNGAGIAEDELNRIWERFYRADKSRSTKGLGLGLSLVKQIAEYHGGEASVVSKIGVGSTFTVKIKR